MNANARQVGGSHYKKLKIEHWDFVAANNLDYFQGQITKYVVRWKDKNGLVDLEKAKHFLDKYIELAKDEYIEEQIRKEQLVPERKSTLTRHDPGGMVNPYGYDESQEQE